MNTPSATNYIHKKIAYTGLKYIPLVETSLNESFTVQYLPTIDVLEELIQNQTLLDLPDVLIIEIGSGGKCFKLLKKIRANPVLNELIIILLGDKTSPELTKRAMKYHVNDLYCVPFSLPNMCERVHFLIKFKLSRPEL